MATAELTREVRDKRIAVAKDVIARIDVQAITFGAGDYVMGRLPEAIDGSDDVQKHVDTIEKHCTVCMLGGLLLSKARLFDGVPISHIQDGTFLISAERGMTAESLSDVFDDVTLDLLESAFERNEMGNEADDDDQSAAVQFGMTFGDDDRARARAIAQILIDNDGEFIVPAAPAA